MQDLQYYAEADIKQLESLIQVDDLLKVINYRLETVQKGPDKWKCFCPIHKEKVFRSLTINIIKRTYRCNFTQCPGHRGGSYLDLYRRATGKDEIQTVEFWSNHLKYPVSRKDEPPSEPILTESVEPEEEPEPVVFEQPQYDDSDVDALIGTVLDLEEEQQQEEEEKVLSEEILEEPETISEEFPQLEPDQPVMEPVAAVEPLLQSQPAVATLAPPVRTSEQYVLEINHRIAGEQLEEARKLLEEALENHPDHPELSHTRVRLLQIEGKVEEAVECLRRLIDYYAQRHLPEGRLRAGHQILELQPHALDAYDAIADAHLERHETSQAVRFLQQAAIQSMELNAPQGALERLDRIREIQPDDSRALEEKIQILAALGRTPEAVAAQIELARLYIRKELVGKATSALERAIDIEPESLDAHQALADLYLARGMQQQAVQEMQRLAELHLGSQQVNEAIGVFKRILELEPKQTEARNRLALLYKHAGRNDLAIEEYLQIAGIYREKEMVGRALRVYESVLKMTSDRRGIRQKLVETLLEKGDESAAIEQLLLLADEAASQGNGEDAESAFEQALQLAPNREDLHRKRISFYLDSGRVDHAVKAYEVLLTLLEQLQNEPAIQDCCEAILKLDSGHTAARARLESLMQAPPRQEATGIGIPGSVQGLTAHAKALVGEGQLDAAIEALRSALIIESKNIQIWEDLAETCLKAGRTDEAVETSIRLSHWLVQDNRIEEALRTLQGALERIPDHLELLRALSKLQLETGAREQALHSLQRMVQLQPDGAEAWYALAKLADEQRQEDLALDAFRQAAHLYMENRQRSKALECLKRAIEVTPEDIEMRLQLIRLLTEAGDLEQALSQQLQIAAICKASDEPRKALDILDEVLKNHPDHLVALQEWFTLSKDFPDLLHTQLNRALHLASVYRNQGLVGKAGQHLDLLQNLFPLDVSVREAQIEFFHDTGSTQKAVAHLLELGQSYQKGGQFEAALEAFVRAERFAPEQFEPLLAQLGIHREQNQPKEYYRLLMRLAAMSEERGLIGKEIAYLTEAWEVQPQCSEPAEKLVEVYLAKGDDEDAIAVLQRLIERYQKEDAQDQVRSCYERILEVQPEGIQFRLELAQQLLAQDERGLASDQLERIARVYAGQTPPTDPQTVSILEKTYRLLFDLTGDPIHLRHLGRLHHANRDDPSAQCDYQEALERCPKETPEIAIEICRELLQVAPGESAIQRRLVELYRETGQAAEAAPILKSLWSRYLRNWEQAGGENTVREGALVERVVETAAQLLELQPEDLMVQEQMADFCLAIGRDQEAITHYATLGEVYTERGDKLRALDAYRRILGIRPDLLEVRIRVAEVLESQGQTTQAMEEYFELGQAALAQEQWQEAGSSYRRVLDLSPTHRPALLGLLEVSRRLEDVEEQKALLLKLSNLGDEEASCLQAFLELEPEDHAIRERYVRVLLSEGQYELLLEQLSLLLPHYEESGQYDGALDLLDRIKERFPGRIEPFRLAIELVEYQETRAKEEQQPPTALHRILRRLNAERYACSALFRQAGQTEQEMELLTRMVQSDEEEESARRRLVEIYRQAGDKSKAVALLQHLGDLAMRRGLLDEAYGIYSQALELSPRSRNLRKRIADLEAQRGSVEDAVKNQRQLVNEALEEGDWSKAEKALEELLQYLPEDEESLKLLAERYREQGETEKACDKADALIQLMERRLDNTGILEWSGFILEFQPERSEILQKRISALLELGQMEQAGELLHRLGEIHRAGNQTQAEMVACQKILDLGLDRYDLNLQAACRLFELGQVRRSRVELEHLAEQCLEQERAADAVGVYQFLCEQFSDETDYRLALAVSLAKSGDTGSALQKRLDLHELYRAQNRPVEMVANLRAVVALSPQDAGLHQLLGEVFTDLGNYREAIQCFVEAARLAETTQDMALAIQCHRNVLQLEPTHLEAHRSFNHLQSGKTLSEEEKEELLTVRQNLLHLLAAQTPPATQEIEKIAEAIQADYPGDERALRILADAYQRLQPAQAVQLHLRLLAKSIRRKDWKAASAELSAIRQIGALELKSLQQLIRLCEDTPLIAEILPERLKLAEACIAQQDREGAIAEYEKLLELAPERREFRQALAENLEIAGQHQRARREKLILAREFEAEGRLQEAIQWTESALTYEKNDRECLQLLAELRCRMGDLERAREVIQQLAEQAESEGNLPLAEKQLQRLIELFPQDGFLWEKLAQLRSAAGNTQGADEAIRQGADVYAAADKISQAIQLYEQLAQRQPERIEIREHLAELLRAKGWNQEALEQEQAIIQWYLQKGQPDRALACYEGMQERDPQNLSIRQEMADLYLHLNRKAEAVQVLFDLAQICIEREMIRRAQSLLQKILSIDPTHRQARQRLALLYVEKGMENEGQQELLQLVKQIHTGQIPSDSAEQEIESLGIQILELNPEGRETLTELAEMIRQRRQDNPSSARELMVNLAVALARLHLARGVADEAERCIQDIESIDAKRRELRGLREQLDLLQRFRLPQAEFEQNLARSQEHWEHGEYGAAAQLMEQLLQSQPRNLDLIQKLAEAYNRQGQTSRAAELLHQRGQAFLSERHLEGARQCFHLLLEAAPEQFSTHLALAQLALAEGNTQAALDQYIHLADRFEEPRDFPLLIEALERALEIDPGNEEALRRLAVAHTRQGKPDKAREYYRSLAGTARSRSHLDGAIGALKQALSLEPVITPESAAQASQEAIHQSVLLHQELAEVLMQANKMPQAVEHWLTAGRMALVSGDLDLARNGFDRVLEYSSRQTESEALIQAYEGLADIHSQWGKPEQAAEVLSRLAQHYGERNQLEDSIRILEQAIELAPRQRQYLEKLCQAYQQAGREDDYIRSGLRLAQVLLELDLVGKAEGVYRTLCALPRWDEEGRQPDQGQPSFLDVILPLLHLSLDKGATADAVELLGNLSERYRRFDRYEDALEQLQRIVQIQPEHLETLEAISSIYQELGDEKSALDALGRLASLHEKRGHPQGALNLYLQMLDLDANHERALSGVERVARVPGQSRQVAGILLERFEKHFTEKQAEATQSLGRALLRLDPATADSVRMRLPEVWVWQGNPSTAAEELRRLGQKYAENREWAAAERSLKRALEIAPGDEELHRMLLEVEQQIARFAQSKHEESIRRKVEELLQSPQPHEALEHLEGLLAGNREDPLLMEWAAELFEQAGRGLEPFTEEQESAVRQSWRERGMDLRMNLARLMRELGHLERARDQAERILELNPEHRDASLLLLEILETTGSPERLLETGRQIAKRFRARNQWETTVEILQWLLKRFAQDTGVLGDLASAYTKMDLKVEAAKTCQRQAEAFLEQELYAQALSAYNQVLTFLPDDLETLDALARVYTVRGDLRGAQTYYRKILDQHLSRNRWAESESVLSKMVDLEPTQPALRRERIELHKRQGKQREIRQELEILANLYLDQELINKAIEVWQEILTLEPDNRPIRIQLIEGYLHKGQPVEAARQYLKMADVWRGRDDGFAGESLQQAVRLAPEEPEVLEIFIDFLAQRGRKRECLVHMQQLATLYEHRGALSDAVRVLQQMQTMEPGNRFVLEQLVGLLETMNRPDQAAPFWEALAEIHEQSLESDQAVDYYLRAASYYLEAGMR